MLIKNEKDFGKALRLLRARGGRAQTEVSQTVGLDRTYLSHLEASRRLPSPGTLLKLVHELGGEIRIYPKKER